MESKSPDRLTLLLLSLTSLFGGSNAIAVQFSNAELPPFFGAALRFGLAALILSLLVLVMRLPLPSGRSLWGAFIFGVLAFGLNYAFLYWSLLFLQAGLTMVILALVPLLTFLFAIAHKQETFRLEALIGSLLALFGIGIVFLDQISMQSPILPMLAVVAAAACFAEATVLLKTFPQAHPITTNALGLFSGTAILLIISIAAAEEMAAPTLFATWAALFYLIFLGSIATFIMSLVIIRRWTASASAYMFVLFPIVTVIVAGLISGETVTVAFLIGGLFVLFGVYIGGLAKRTTIKRVYAGVQSLFMR
jgi:drug/metabolite transporter (DMT)-like permease